MLSRRSERAYWLMVLPLLVLIVVFYGWPVFGILLLSVTEPRLGLDNYAQLATNPALVRLIVTTLRVCAITTVFSVLLGYLLAYVMSHSLQRRHNRMLALLVLSFWISVLVRAFAWLTLLGRQGLVNSLLVGAGLVGEPLSLVRNEFGVLIGMVHYMIPYATLPLLANMRGIDGRIADASRSLGASTLTTFRRIYLPLTLPGIVAASLLVFIISLGFYVTPAILGGGRVLMIAEYVSVQVLVTLQWGVAAMLATLLLVGILGLLFVLSRFMKIAEAFGARP
jgi:putative spermidine/putrescine transport system permease protein